MSLETFVGQRLENPRTAYLESQNSCGMTQEDLDREIAERKRMDEARKIREEERKRKEANKTQEERDKDARDLKEATEFFRGLRDMQEMRTMMDFVSLARRTIPGESTSGTSMSMDQAIEEIKKIGKTPKQGNTGLVRDILMKCFPWLTIEMKDIVNDVAMQILAGNKPEPRIQSKLLDRLYQKNGFGDHPARHQRIGDLLIVWRQSSEDILWSVCENRWKQSANARREKAEKISKQKELLQF